MNEQGQNEHEKRYSPPLDKLLSLGDPRKVPQWPDYLAMGFTREHIPDLIRMATDPELSNAWSDSLEVWARLLNLL